MLALACVDQDRSFVFAHRGVDRGASRAAMRAPEKHIAALSILGSGCECVRMSVFLSDCSSVRTLTICTIAARQMPFFRCSKLRTPHHQPRFIAKISEYGRETHRRPAAPLHTSPWNGAVSPAASLWP